MADPKVPGDGGLIGSVDKGQRLRFGQFSADPQNYGHGGVVDVYFARFNDDGSQSEENDVVIRAAKAGSEGEFAEEIHVRKRAQRLQDSIITSHMPQMVDVDMTHRPPYLVVRRIKNARPLNELVKEDLLNPTEKRSMAQSLLEYVHHWHQAGIVLDDLGGEPDKGALSKCDRFLVLVGPDAPKQGIGWIDIDANLTRSIAVQNDTFDRIEVDMRKDLDQSRSLFLWAKASVNADFQTVFSNVTQTVADMPVWSSFEAELQREAGGMAFDERGFIRRIGDLPATEEAIQRAQVKLQPKYADLFTQAKAQKLKALHVSVQAARKNLTALGIGDKDRAKVVSGEIVPQGLDVGEAEKIQIFCQLLQKAEKGDKELASFVAEHGLEIQKWHVAISIVQKKIGYLAQQGEQIERLADIRTTDLVYGIQSVRTQGLEGSAERGLQVIKHLHHLPDLVVEHKTGVITRRDYESLAGIFSELVTNGKPDETQSIYDQFIAMIERESATMDMSYDMRVYEGMKRILSQMNN